MPHRRAWIVDVSRGGPDNRIGTRIESRSNTRQVTNPQHDREFWLEVDQGLCNRMRTLLCAIGFCEMTERRLVICWPTTPSLPFREKLHRFVTKRPHPRTFDASLSDLWDLPYREVTQAEFQAQTTREDSAAITLPPEQHIPDPAMPARVVYLRTIAWFDRGLPMHPSKYSDRLRLTPMLKGRLDDYLRNELRGGSPLIGVHIRSNLAHQKTANTSPPEWFENRMAELLKQYPRAAFYLSADSSEVSKRIHRRFPGIVRELCQPPGYNSREGIQKGLLDLHILAATQYIVGSYYSSFSDMAVLLQDYKGWETAVERCGKLPDGGAHP